MQALLRCLPGAFVGAALCVSVVGTSVAADTAASCRPLDTVQQRVVDKADQGADSLRQYVYITRGIHRLDMVEDVAPKLDAWRAQSRCAKLAAEEAAAQRHMAKATAPF